MKEHAAAYCYTAQFAKGKRSSIGIGLSGCNQFHLYDSKKDYALCGKIQMQAPCYTIDFGNESRYMAVSGAEGVIYLLIVDWSYADNHLSSEVAIISRICLMSYSNYSLRQIVIYLDSLSSPF